MRFIVRQGVDPVARADATLLKALGLPYGGVLKVGKTHVLVKAGDTKDSTALHLGAQAMSNAGVADGQSVDAVRAVLSHAALVRLSGDNSVDAKVLQQYWQGRPLSDGDQVSVPAAQTGTAETVAVTIVQVEPGEAGLVGPGTRFVFRDDEAPEPVAKHPAENREPNTSAPPAGPSRSEALLAGLDDQKDLLTGWLSLLTSSSDLPAAWGLPRVAGVLLEGPQGCGKSELVAAAADEAGAIVHEVSLDQVFKPEKLLDVLETAIRTTNAPAVIFVDRLELVSGDEGMAPFRTQMAAVLRWFLDSLAAKPGRACVIGCSSRAALDPAIASSPLLPRSLSIPPPDLHRRQLLFEAALA
ncbi:MAG TPA: AAA family ATPase, partial [Acidimicrobiia bacterium]|nr:AAA family ATPase [Acidimicrobiia bacterium]